MYNGEYWPGFVVPSERVCYLSYDGPVVRKSDYEVLVVDDETGLEWLATDLSEYEIGVDITFCVDKPFSEDGDNENVVNIGRTHAHAWEDAELLQIVGAIPCGELSYTLYVSYNGRQHRLYECDLLVIYPQPNTLKELCRYKILNCTHGISKRIDRLPLPKSLLEFCQLRKEEVKIEL